ncbi:hypothetical protein [Caballeronia sp. S22]|uniref:hypothetical protein n=1 Tax=Caballeronia sp. S22 TaxID=3137182 RepID=UPI003530E8B7
MANRLLFGLVMTALASSAIAGEHYVEVWNPPEVRGNVPAVTAHVRKPLKKRHLSFKALSPTATHPVVKAPATRQSATATQVDIRPAFDDIPLQITPEGTILRVSRGPASASAALLH